MDGNYYIARRQKHALACNIPIVSDRLYSDKRGMINKVIKIKLQCVYTYKLNVK